MTRSITIALLLALPTLALAEDRLPTPAYRRQSSDPEWLAQVVQFHGHLGPSVVAGARLGMIGLRAVGAHGYFDVEVTCEGPMAQPPQACFLDGLQVATGATLGKRTLTWVPAGQIAVRVRNTRTGAAVALRPTPMLMELLASFKSPPKAGVGHGAGQKADQRLEAAARKIAAMPENQIADTTLTQPKETPESRVWRQPAILAVDAIIVEPKLDALDKLGLAKQSSGEVRLPRLSLIQGDPALQVQQWEQRGWVNVLARPTRQTLDGRETCVEIGMRVPVVQAADRIALADCGFRVLLLPRLVRDAIQLGVDIAGGWEDPPGPEPQDAAHPRREIDPVRWKITNTTKTTVVVPKGQTVALTIFHSRFRSLQGDPLIVILTPRVVDSPAGPGG
jgi:formylmethanofuran dehydrogenase subunit E